jgi:hypothetical protein
MCFRAIGFLFGLKLAEIKKIHRLSLNDVDMFSTDLFSAQE